MKEITPKGAMKRWILPVTIAANLIASPALLAGDDEFHSLPDVVATAIATAFPDFALREAKLKSEDGKEYFKLEGNSGDDEIEARISPEGEIIKLEINDIDQPIVLPEAVQAAVDAIIPELTVRESKFDLDDENYKVEGVDAAGNEVELRIAPDGTVVKFEVNDEDVIDDSVDDDSVDDDSVDDDSVDDDSVDDDSAEDDSGDDDTADDDTADDDTADNDSADDDTVGDDSADDDSADDDSPGDGNDFPVDGALPGAVDATLKAVAPGIVIEEIKLRERGAKTYYKIEGMIEGVKVEVKIASDGTLLEMETEDSDDGETGGLPIDSLPEAVVVAIAEIAPGLIVNEIGLDARAAGIRYEIEGVLDDGSKIEINVSADGEIHKIERDGRRVGDKKHQDDEENLSESDLPEPVRAALALAAPGIEIREIESKSGAGDVDYYKIEGTVDGARVELKISAEGEIRRHEMDSDDDGIGDAEEMENGSDPNDPDSDDDVFPDGFEKNRGADPRNRHSRPDIVRPRTSSDGNAIVMVIDTVEGVFFQIEVCTDAAGNLWEARGDAFEGSGLPVEVEVPRDDASCGLIRIRVHR